MNMNVLKSASSILLLLFLSVKTIAQGPPPPPPAMPTAENKILIDKILKVTNHEAWFKEYCESRVLRHAETANWGAAKTKEIISSIKFKDYNHTIYNSYAFFTTEQLTQLLDALTALKMSKVGDDGFILTNSMMQINLDTYVAGVISGSYVMSK